jgi:hypothetical protein
MTATATTASLLCQRIESSRIMTDARFQDVSRHGNADSIRVATMLAFIAASECPLALPASVLPLQRR